jgi:FAD/FMN-containing dehydrogenase
VDSHPVVMVEEAEQVKRLCRKMGANSIEQAETDAQWNKIWAASLLALDPDNILNPGKITGV